MSLTVLYNVKKTKLGALELDATISENHTMQSDVTEHPIEKGADVADHVRPKPRTYTVTGLVSNTPISQSARDARGPAVKGDAGPAESAFATLERLFLEQTVLTVSTRQKSYDNMVMVDLQVPRDASTGDALKFTATFKQIRVAEIQTTKVQKTSLAKGKTKVDSGKQAPSTTEDATKSKSILKSAADTETGKTVIGGLKKFFGAQ